MKKIFAILLIAASVVSLASCKVKKGNGETEPYNHDEYVSNMAAVQEEQSKAAAEKAEKEAQIQEEIDDYIKKVGKTKKNSRIVVQCNVSDVLGKEYWVLEFKANGEYKTKLEYYFFPTLEQYNAKVDIAKDVDGYKLAEKDKDTKMVVIQNDKFISGDFDVMYERFKSDAMKESGYIIIE